MTRLVFRSPDGRCTDVNSDDTINIRKLTSLGWVCPELNRAARPPVEASALTASVPTSAAQSTPPATTSPETVGQGPAVDAVLELLGHDEDLRIRTHVRRIQAYLSDRRAGARTPKRYHVATEEPF